MRSSRLIFLVPTLLAAPLALGQEAPSAAAAPQVDAALGKGVHFQGAEGFDLTVRARIQVLANFTELNAGVLSSRPPDFAVRRARVVLTGQATRDFAYHLQLGLAPLDLETGMISPVRDAYLTWKRWRVLQVRAGQMKVPFDRQRMTSSSALQLVDRSLVMRELTLDRDIGVTLFSDDLLGTDRKLAYRLGVFGGEGRSRTTQTPGLLYSARLEATPLGSFNTADESDLEREPRPRLGLGVAVANHAGTRRTLSTTGDFFPEGTARYRHATADVHFKWRGVSALASGLYRKAGRRVFDAEARELSRSGWGGFVQGGVFVARPLELTARYGALEPLPADRSALQPLRELGGGLNLFASGRALNLQADYFYLWHRSFSGGDHQVRVQTQVYF